MAALRRPPVFAGRRAIALGGAAAGIGFLLCALGLFIDPARTWLSYLNAFTYAVSIAVGALVLQMAGYAAGSRWMSVIRRFTESIALAFPVLAALFVPLLFGADYLYPWMSPPAHLGHVEHELLHHRAAYLNLPGFAVRGALYFAVWMTAAGLLRRWSRARDRAEVLPSERPSDSLIAERPEVPRWGTGSLRRERALSSALLPLVGLAITFAAFDWVMSLEVAWYSTIFGVYLFAGGFVAAIGLVIRLARSARDRHDMAWAITPNHFHALGRLLFAFVVFWAYCAFFQALLILIANRPEEVVFYIERSSGAWAAAIYVLVLGHFALPFLLLLPRRVKFRPRAMAVAGAWMLVMHLVDVYWLIVPSRVQGIVVFHWLDLAALAAVLGSAVAFAAWRQRGVPLLARDPHLAEGIAYRSPL